MSAFERALCDFRIDVDIAHLQAARQRLMAAERVPNTLKAYVGAWEQFSTWCAHYGLDPLPASSDTIQLFITASIERGLRLKTVRCYLSGVIWKHASSSLPSPMDDEIRALMKNASRALKEKSVGKSALTPEQLREMCECRHGSADPMDIRDRLRAALEKIGVDPSGFGGDSLRLGMLCSCCCRAPVRAGDAKQRGSNSRVCRACGNVCDVRVL